MNNITRLFDFPYHQLEKYNLKDALVTKYEGQWIKTSTQEYLDKANAISRGLLRLGVNRNDKIAIISSNNRTEWHITDIGVFTSLFEGLSVAVIEKMLMKIPLVATNISMMEALIKNGDNGFLFQPGDEQALAMFLIKLIDDTDLRRTMGEKAYESVKDYSLTRTVQQHEAFYIHAIES